MDDATPQLAPAHQSSPKIVPIADDQKMQQLVSLCKRRGFVFQSSEIYGGLKSAYDYGPLGAELKRNLMQAWWQTMVHTREDVVGLDASIMMHSKVWETSGHLAGFSDPLVDCRNCKERFRADKAPMLPVGQAITWHQGGKKAGSVIKGQVGAQGYVCPICGSSDLSAERPFNLMFRTNIGAIDPLHQLKQAVQNDPNMTGTALMARIEALWQEGSIYLRPETAQAMFVQFLNVQTSMAMKVPFGIAQMGKSFRNEITVEHFIFRSCEFEQMEMEFFVPPGEQQHWLSYWCEQRLAWWRHFANNKDAFRLRAHDPAELAHYADACFDIEYAYPWGFGELEGIASRTDYDLRKHGEASGTKLSYFDPQAIDPATGKPGWRYIPYVVEPAAGATRGVLVYLLDALTCEQITMANGEVSERWVLRLHPRLAPIKAAVLPLVKKDGLPAIGRDIVQQLHQAGINASYDEQHAIGRRYRRHDEIGTPFCLTVDGQTKEDGTLTIRYRDTMAQQRIPIGQAVSEIERQLRAT